MRLFLLCFYFYSVMAFATVKIVAAENFYGDVAKTIGGPYVEVVNILNHPDQDPHLFSVSPLTVKMIQGADLIIYNGANYDPWMDSLLSDETMLPKKIIVAAKLLKINTSQNPHIWYWPETMLLVATQIAAHLNAMDPLHQPYYQHALAEFKMQYQVLFKMIKTMHDRYNQVPVIATEPIFNYMAAAIGLKMQAIPFQENVMNDVTPSISEITAFENDLRQRTVRVFIYNKQVDNPLTKRLLSIANNEKIPVLGVTETLPLNRHYISWMVQQLTDLNQRLL